MFVGIYMVMNVCVYIYTKLVIGSSGYYSFIGVFHTSQPPLTLITGKFAKGNRERMLKVAAGKMERLKIKMLEREMHTHWIFMSIHIYIFTHLSVCGYTAFFIFRWL